MMSEIDKGFEEKNRAQQYFASKKRRVERILSDPKRRERMLRRLSQLAEKQSPPEKVDLAVCLGMSFSKFPDRLLKKIYETCLLWHQGRTERIAFTGARFHAVDDYDQAAIAKQIAIEQFGIPEDVILTAGGRNTQENLEETRRILDIKTGDILLVAESHHLLRAMSTAQGVFSKEINVFPSPVKGTESLSPDDILAIEELAKSRAYKGSFYSLPFSSPEIREYIREQAEELAGYLKGRIKSGDYGKYPEEAFSEWYTNLSKEHQFLGPDFKFPKEIYDYRNPILPDPSDYKPYKR